MRKKNKTKNEFRESNSKSSPFTFSKEINHQKRREKMTINDFMCICTYMWLLVKYNKRHAYTTQTIYPSTYCMIWNNNVVVFFETGVIWNWNTALFFSLIVFITPFTTNCHFNGCSSKEKKNQKQQKNSNMTKKKVYYDMYLHLV